ncbi:MAG TPA: ABC transporter ATP-binding protein [Candidatus Aminicenantes bacterium]|nr:ABC transporter ATP-binding protein [Candidatus Aminicenantes bacterium]
MTAGGRILRADKLGKWYGNVLGLSDVSIEIGPGITGLLGPNGAGKSTFMKLITGQLRPSIGTVTIAGQPVWNNPGIFKSVGLCPEQDAFYEDTTGREFLSGLLALGGFPAAEIRERTARALAFVELQADADRLIRGYSRGMRQRLKISQALAHEPEILILDEPLNGLDPLSKRKVIRLIKEYRTEGRTVLVSSHVLPEIEALTRSIILIHQGKILAQGDIHFIRDLIDAHPHIVAVRTGRGRALAAKFVEEDDVRSVRFDEAQGTVLFETRNRDRFFERLTRLAAEEGWEIEEITSPDDNLQSVFDYLVGK